MRSILLYAHDDECFEARRRVAFDLARAVDGHVTCLQSIPYEFGAMGDFSGGMAAQVIPALRERADKHREAIEAKLAGKDVPWDWADDVGAPRYRIPSLVHLTDLVVMGACSDTSGKGGYSALAAEMAIYGRTPVLLVPPTVRSFDVSGPAAIAWNGSPEASHALRAALPLLRKASEVYLFTVEDHASSDALPDISAADYLARHGIASEVVALPVLKDGIAETLFHGALQRGASYMVLGAYGHSRLRETVLGGVTRSMMKEPQLPLFLSH